MTSIGSRPVDTGRDGPHARRRSTRKYVQVGEPVGNDVEASSSSTSKTAVSELFIERTRTALSELMGRRLDDVRLAVMMLDKLEIADRTRVVVLGITTEGVKIPLGLWEGSTENATLARTLLADLVDRRLDSEQAILLVIDGGKALRKAIKDVFGEHAHSSIAAKGTRRETSATCCPGATRAGPRPDARGMVARRRRPGRAATTAARRRARPHLARRRRVAEGGHARHADVDRLGITGMLVAAQEFRRIIGYRDLAKLVIAVKRHSTLIAQKEDVRQEVAEPVTV